ncbi:MAG: hypothetical protein HDS21_01870 [Bacteroides sp.]|nr:hypothetical protein [Bacteroides sp.]
MDPITETIKSYFDSKEWKYRLEEKSYSKGTYYVFDLTLRGNNETIDIIIIVDSNRDLLLLNCFPRVRFSPENRLGAITAVNEYNSDANLISTCINKHGDLVFSFHIYTGGINIISEETFGFEFELLFDAANEETAHIYKRALEFEPPVPQKKKRGIFSFFKK